MALSRCSCAFQSFLWRKNLYWISHRHIHLHATFAFCSRTICPGVFAFLQWTVGMVPMENRWSSTATPWPPRYRSSSSSRPSINMPSSTTSESQQPDACLHDKACVFLTASGNMILLHWEKSPRIPKRRIILFLPFLEVKCIMLTIFKMLILYCCKMSCFSRLFCHNITGKWQHWDGQVWACVF